ncbi:MAG: glycosyltransferase family 2 protein [Planctomycetia bacterium]|nr:glycosyltransferase family 2 protein [Planctomycetia bacterium]
MGPVGSDPASRPTPVRLSIVIPVFRGEKTVGPLVHALADCLASLYRLEIVLVNDGSPDRSAEVCRGLALHFRFVKFLNLSRNFSEHNAVMAGLNFCTGDFVVIMDDDFQNPPSEVNKLVNEIQKGYDVVFSYYGVKQHHFLRNLGSRLNDWCAALLLDKPRELYLSSFKVLSRFVVNELIKYDGPYPYIDGLVLRFTRNYSQVLVSHDPRRDGRSGYTLRKLISLYLNMFTNFSILPLRLASFAGLASSIAGLAVAAIFVVEKIYHPELPSGWASMIVSLFIIGGIQLFALGMIGEYLGRLFLKDNGRPQFVIREQLNCEPDLQANTLLANASRPSISRPSAA